MILLPLMVFTITLCNTAWFEYIQALQESPSGRCHTTRIEIVSSGLQDSLSGHGQFNEDQNGYFSSPGQPFRTWPYNKNQDGHSSSPLQLSRTALQVMANSTWIKMVTSAL